MLRFAEKRRQKRGVWLQLKTLAKLSKTTTVGGCFAEVHR